jgi:hypothetical protein
MIATKGLVGGAIAVMASIAAIGCASQSAEFRRMSAADHESAARVAQGDPAQAQLHLEAAKRLRDQEQVACYGLRDSDRVQGPFARPDQITSIEVVRDRGVFPKGPLVPVGVAVDLRAEQGMTQQWLGRVVACHMAHVAVVGQDPQPSPLSVANTQVSVTSTSVGFRVTVTSHDLDVARSVVHKGQELAVSTYGQPAGAAVGVASVR